MSRSARKRRKRRQRTLWLACGAVLLTAVTVLLFFALRGSYEAYVRSTYELEHYDTCCRLKGQREENRTW